LVTDAIPSACTRTVQQRLHDRRLILSVAALSPVASPCARIALQRSIVIVCLVSGQARYRGQRHRQQLGRGGLRHPGRPRRRQPVQHLPVGSQQLLGHRPLPVVNLLQPGPGLADVHCHPLAHHQRQIIPRPPLRDEGQARHQRQPLGLTGVGAAQHIRVGRVRLPGEVSDLRSGDAVQHPGHVPQRRHPLQMRGLGLEPGPGRPARALLQPLKIALAGRAHLQQRRKPAAPVRAQPYPDPLEDLGVHLAAAPGLHRIQRRERRKLQPGLHQSLQRHVDQIRRMVLHPRRFRDCPLRDLACLPGVVVHVALPADQHPVRVTGLDRGVDRQHLITQLKAPPHVFHHRLGHLRRPGEAAHLLETLERQRQREQVLVSVGLLPRPHHLIRRRREEHVQIPRQHHLREDRVRRPLHRRHSATPRHSQPPTTKDSRHWDLNGRATP